MKTITRPASAVARIIELWLMGAKPSMIAERTGLKLIHPILEAHGFPSVDVLRRNLEQLKPLGDLDVTFEVDAGSAPATRVQVLKCAPGRESEFHGGPGDEGCPGWLVVNAGVSSHRPTWVGAMRSAERIVRLKTGSLR